MKITRETTIIIIINIDEKGKIKRNLAKCVTNDPNEDEEKKKDLQMNKT